MRAALLFLVVGLFVVVSAVEVGRPALHNKLLHRKATLGESAASAAVTARIEELRVAAAEREHSLADKFAADLEAHVAAKEAAGAESETEADAETEAETETEAEADADSDHRLVLESLAALEYQNAGVLESGKKKTLRTAKSGWSSCLMNSDKTAGTTTLKAVAFKAAPPLRDQAFVVNIDGQYTGPDVTYGSATLQIARADKKSGPELVYRHSIVMSDVLVPNDPFRAGPLSATMYVPHSAFNLMAKEGDYSVSVTFTNQFKEPFACAKLDFKLD